jgi:hypothetical protein
MNLLVYTCLGIGYVWASLRKLFVDEGNLHFNAGASHFVRSERGEMYAEKSVTDMGSLFGIETQCLTPRL